jgi:predicted SAM-dependent methyltransferase
MIEASNCLICGSQIRGLSQADQKVGMTKNKPKWFFFSFVALVGVPLGLFGASGVKAVQSHYIISNYLTSHAVKKLQIGAGGAKGFPTWLNTDIDPQAGEAYLDATKTFPLPDGVLSYVFSEQVFEHLPYQGGLTMLRESHRTLKPGGKIRITTPNLVRLIQLFQDSKTDEMKTYIEDTLSGGYWPDPVPRTISPAAAILNYEMRNFGHQFLYDPKTLRQSLEIAGFQDIKEVAPGESDDPQLVGLDTRHKAAVHVRNDYETMVFEATRP